MIACAIFFLVQVKKSYDYKKALEDMCYKGAHDFYIFGKGTGWLHHSGKRRWLELVDSKGDYKHTLFGLRISDEAFRSIKKGDFQGTRDLYVSLSDERYCLSVECGQKPDLSGDNQFYEMIAFAVVAGTFLLGAYVALIL